MILNNELLNDIINNLEDVHPSEYLVLVDKNTKRVLGWCSFGGFETDENTEVYKISEIDESTIHDSYYLDGEVVHSQELTDERIVEEQKVQDIQAGAEMMTMLSRRYVLATANDIEAYTMRYLYPTWDKNGVKYKKDERVMYEDKFYKVLNDHTSQESWTPDTASSLFVEISDPSEEYPQWKQPTSAVDAYMKGDKVTFNGKKYISSIDNNTWSPSEYEQGWQLVE